MNPIFSLFDPSKRKDSAELDEIVRFLADHPVMTAVLDSANVSMVVVNEELQIVAANQTILSLLGEKKATALLGKRLGEALGCINADVMANGCGSSTVCASCGAVQVVLETQQSGSPSVGECVIVLDSTRGDRSVELSIRATPVNLGGRDFIVVAMQDVGDRNRRRVLERVFIHDLNNTLTGLIGWCEVLKDDPDEAEYAATHIGILSSRLAREVEEHRILMAIEAEQFVPNTREVSSDSVFKNILKIFEHHDIARNRLLVLDNERSRVDLVTDPDVLERVLVNMVKNALEGTESGGTVRMGCSELDGRCRFYVWNDTYIPEETSQRIFEQSFSTKGESGRGLGTYSMKLFGENCLKGKVWFTSYPKEGTTFYFELPVSFPD